MKNASSPPRAILIRFLFATLLLASLTSCQNYRNQFILGWTQMEAQGLQPVRSSPPSLAYKRLQAHSELNIAVKLFFQAKGWPDYIVEVPGIVQVCIVCYYMKKGEAYLLQSPGYYAPKTRILGPEPIGEKDKKLMKALAELEKATRAYSSAE
jgi:hypothetical protein